MRPVVWVVITAMATGVAWMGLLGGEIVAAGDDYLDLRGMAMVSGVLLSHRDIENPYWIGDEPLQAWTLEVKQVLRQGSSTPAEGDRIELKVEPWREYRDELHVGRTVDAAVYASSMEDPDTKEVYFEGYTAQDLRSGWFWDQQEEALAGAAVASGFAAAVVPLVAIPFLQTPTGSRSWLALPILGGALAGILMALVLSETILSSDGEGNVDLFAPLWPLLTGAIVLAFLSPLRLRPGHAASTFVGTMLAMTPLTWAVNGGPPRLEPWLMHDSWPWMHHPWLATFAMVAGAAVLLALGDQSWRWLVVAPAAAAVAWPLVVLWKFNGWEGMIPVMSMGLGGLAALFDLVWPPGWRARAPAPGQAAAK